MKRLFVLSFENEDDRRSYLNYYTPNIKITDSNVLVDCKRFFDVPVKNKGKVYEKTIEINKNNNYTTGNLLGYEYFSNHYKLVLIDLSRQTELENTGLKQKLISLASLKKIKQQCFLLLRKEKKLLLIFHRIL